MIRIARLAALTLLLGAAGSALGACQAIVGIDDRPYVPVDAGSDTPPEMSQACQDYCAKSREVCGDLLYRTDDACLATCALFPLTGAGTNSVACRTAELAKYEATREPEDLARSCANAGPGGNGVCGSNCENYCRLFAQACSDSFKKYETAAESSADASDDGHSYCVASCLGLDDTHLYDSTDSGNYLGDTLQCRIVHTTNATIDPDTHCDHADLKSNKCFDDVKSEPDCKLFCHLEMTECADYPVYQNETQCEDVCKALPPGHPGDIADNTVACRDYHSYNAIIDPQSHCPHTGPGGDGHCSTDHDPVNNTGNCESYCLLLEKACKSDFDSKFDDQAACEADCAGIDGATPNAGYSLAAQGNNVQCRLLHVSRALSNAKECGAAQGAAPCK